MPVMAVLPALFELAISIFADVRAAVDRDSDGGKKITGDEWAAIVSRAAAKLSMGLTGLFASKLDRAAQATFSEGPE